MGKYRQLFHLLIILFKIILREITMNVHSIPGKLTVQLRKDVKAILDTWKSYDVTVDQFKEAVLDKGIGSAKVNRCESWIVDSSDAEGTFSKEIQDFIGSDVFPEFTKNGIKNFITIKSEKSALTRISENGFKVKAGPRGLKLVEAENLETAIDWIKKNS